METRYISVHVTLKYEADYDPLKTDYTTADLEKIVAETWAEMIHENMTLDRDDKLSIHVTISEEGPGDFFDEL